MYYVYKIELPFKHVYIGATNNITRRKDQHNENARKEKSYFGRYLKENNIILNQDNFEILYSSEKRKEALKQEEYYIKKYDNDKNYVSLNESKTKREKKKVVINKTCLEYIVIDFVDHNFWYVKDIREYELNNDFCRGCLHRTVRSKFTITKNRYKAFYLNVWNNMTADEKEYYLSGKFLEDKNKKLKENKQHNYQKRYLVENKSGETFVVTNLNEFARQHGINKGNLHNSFKSHTWCNNYRVKERL
ncbi:MAG: GIY-YIG nuclease family protein [Methanobrevibacter sp.]|nr:GIY-YIG nuclease family protein [Methanobrevibacter sp.]